jgi:hypothetical protein
VLSLRSNLLGALAENTALLISMMEFGTVLTNTAAHPTKEFGSNQHPNSRRQEIDPKAMSVAAYKVPSQKFARDSCSFRTVVFRASRLVFPMIGCQ